LRLCVDEVLAAHRASARAAEDLADAPVVFPGLAGIGLGELEVGASLRDLLRPAAVAHARDDGGLRRGLRLGLSEPRREALGVEDRQHLALAHAIALLHEHPGDALAVVEGEIDLPQVDVAVEHDVMAGGMAVREPPAEAGGGERQNGEGDDPFLLHDEPRLVLEDRPTGNFLSLDINLSTDMIWCACRDAHDGPDRVIARS
jgi:hypothetical protein